MSIPTYLHLGSNTIKSIHTTEFKITRNIDEHSSLLLTIIVEEQSDIDYIYSTDTLGIIEIAIVDTPMAVGTVAIAASVEAVCDLTTATNIIDSFEYETIFKGAINQIKIIQLDTVYSLTINAVSDSFLVDNEIIDNAYNRAIQGENNVIMILWKFQESLRGLS